MGWLLEQGVAALLLAGAALVLVRGRQAVGRGRAVGRRLARAFRRPPPPGPAGRPIELVAREARRLGARYRATRQGVSFTKYEAVRLAYDHVLGEGCDALGLPHLLGVLPPGDELDAERTRVERLLDGWGVALDDAA